VAQGVPVPRSWVSAQRSHGFPNPNSDAAPIEHALSQVDREIQRRLKKIMRNVSIGRYADHACLDDVGDQTRSSASAGFAETQARLGAPDDRHHDEESSARAGTISSALPPIPMLTALKEGSILGEEISEAQSHATHRSHVRRMEQLMHRRAQRPENRTLQPPQGPLDQLVVRSVPVHAPSHPAAPDPHPEACTDELGSILSDSMFVGGAVPARRRFVRVSPYIDKPSLLPRSLPDLASVSSRPSAGDQFWSSVQSQGLAGPGPNQMISPQGGKPWATRASRRASAHPPDAHAVLMEGSQPAATFPNRLGVAATASGAQMHVYHRLGMPHAHASNRDPRNPNMAKAGSRINFDSDNDFDEQHAAAQMQLRSMPGTLEARVCNVARNNRLNKFQDIIRGRSH